MNYKNISIFNFYLFLPILVLGLIISSCSSTHKRPTGFEMSNEVILPTVDTSKKNIYITSTKPIDSVNTKQIIYDIFRLETNKYPDSIYFYARIYDSLGHFVTNMADPYKKDKSAKYFGNLYEKVGKVYKSRTETIPEYKIREYGANDSIPYQIVLTMDYSGSMINVKDAMFEATNLFIDLKFPYDRIAITSFNSTYEVKVPMMSDLDRIKTLYNAKKEQGFKPMSALNDAVYNSLSLIDTTEKKAPRLLVVFSDGDENYSKKKIGDIIKYAKSKDIHIFTIGFGYTIDNNLMYMANYTGGKYYKAKSKAELTSIFRDIYMSLRFYYLVSYHPPKYWGYHKVFSELSLPKRDSVLVANTEYDTGDMFDFSQLNDAFNRPILFEFNKYNLDSTSNNVIDEIVDAMLSKPSIRLEIQGHTDNIGTQEINQVLSENRASEVMNAIIKRGIDPIRLRSRGFGFSQPVANNDTPENRALNRRTVFVITAK